VMWIFDLFGFAGPGTGVQADGTRRSVEDG